jgi:hypothetical protein
MSRVVTRGLKRQSKLGRPQQPVHEATHSQEQPCFQTKGIQWIDAPNNEPRQHVMANLPFH